MKLAAAGVAVALAAAVPAAHAQSSGAPSCAPGGPPVTFTGSLGPADARTYRELAFDVAAGTTRVELTYDWSGEEAVLDLGLWDPGGFRGWSGSRGGRVATGQQPVFVQPDAAARGYRPGPIAPGPWFADLGVAQVGPDGATYTVTATCRAPSQLGPPFVADAVDPTHVADPDAGWYHGDLHMHGFHSHARGPSHQALVDTARAAGLDFLPITEYVTGQHWDELGPVQRANPDVVLWPGREIITYFGHANAVGETRSVLEYRHGHDGVALADIQARTVRDGALFQVNHPEFFPPPLGSLCRGCYFELGDHIDWSAVDTFEVLTGPILVAPSDIGAPAGGELFQNPFVQPAIDRWESLLRQGLRITAVSGSDSKGVEDDPERRGYGSSATAVFASELSRPALIEAVRAGHAYVRTRGVDASPEIELTATAADGATAMMGDTLVADAAVLSVTVRGGTGQAVTVLRDGEPVGLPVPVTSDPFTHTVAVARTGPTTFWRVDVADVRSLTAITNPIFLTGTGDPPAAAPAPVPPSPAGGDPLPRTGGGGGAALGAGAVLLAAGLLLHAVRTSVR